MTRKLYLITGLVLLLIGCDSYYIICSLNPFYLEKNIILSPAFEGEWMAKPSKTVVNSTSSIDTHIWGVADTTSSWTIKRYISKLVVKTRKGEDSTVFKTEDYYLANLLKRTDSTNYEFKVVLFQIKNGLYADFIPLAKEGLIKSKLASYSFFELHTLARITISHDQMKLSWLGADCMKEMIEKKRVRIKYQWVAETKRFLLTASSHDLTGMIERYADQPRFIDWERQEAKLDLNRLN